MNTKVTRRHFLASTAAAVASAGVLGSTKRSIAAPASGEPIVIGHQCELTGWDAATGYWRDKAATGLTKWINDTGGIAGRPIKLVTVDTKSDVDAGVTQLRNLILEEKVDFVIGSEISSIALASNKIANENKTLYMTMSTSEATTANGNAVPYQFRMTTNSAATAAGAAQKLVESIGKRWATFFADIKWGQSERDWWQTGVTAAGGEVTSATAIPVDAADLLPFVARIDRSVDGIYIPVLNALQAVQLIRSSGYPQKIVLAGLSFSLFDYRELGPQGEGTFGIETAPIALADMPSSEMGAIYKALGIDENGIETASGKAAGGSMIRGIAQSLGFIKANVEQSGWTTKDDTAALIKHAETVPTYQRGPLFPLGDVSMRAEDHQAFMDIYLLQIRDGLLSKFDVAPWQSTLYPADVDLTKG
ncbi:ABC transporter substrate-binding protein [Microbaculum marinisediminis]|uniref:ABC transporter substrate-binding protein n=1 Tax=Microbaculum marinisediminis TaxID=2931392 RepID=A0AAW5R2Q5_9HYPH|nr:ABC transporter substrate-binding protein [Microbaculum sp. A6E488]MCT8974253.1 ABC transporter substrate-binding protein [Microbaculum sp. A6E488]